MNLNKIYQYAVLMRLNKPIGIFLLLWPTLIAVWIASQGYPDPKLLFIFVTGVIIMRSAGCVINDIADQKWDGKVSRTSSRPLVTQEVTQKEAFVLFTILIILAFILVLQLNPLTIGLSFLSLLFAMIYPLMKRITHIPQLILGIAFSMSIPMAFSAVMDTIPWMTWPLLLANLCWVVAYDTQYAMVDREDDIKIGVKSTAILFGAADRLIILCLQLLTLALFLKVGLSLNLNIFYYFGVSAAGLQMLYQFKLIFKREPAQCFKAFLNNHFFGLWIFLGVVLAYAT